MAKDKPTHIRVYTDESVPVAIAEGLQRRGVDAWSARDAGNLGLSDEEQLEYASREETAIFTHDDDFLVMVKKVQRDHFGVIYAHQQDLSIGECIRRLKALTQTKVRDELKNGIEFL